jgi:hypothetical protein
MRSLFTIIGLASLALAICLTSLCLGGGWLGFARFERDKRIRKEFHVVKSIAAPDRTKSALLFEHLPTTRSDTNPVEEIVVVAPHASISIPELWMRMKTNGEVLRANASAPSTIGIEWQNSSSLLVTCINCSPAMEVVRRAPHTDEVSIQYVGFPKDASYTNVDPVEK